MADFIINDPPHVPEDMADDVLPLSLDDPNFRVGARLCNFPTGRATIRSSHVKWVRDEVEPLFKPPGDWSIDLLGHASRLGSGVSNLALSHRRMDAVHALLETRAGASPANVFFRHADAKGEEEATGFGLKEESNSGMFRAVDVLLFGAKRPPIVIPCQS
jgi:outer membrane protein OmpA-like peptidoglycan-associated protein